MSAAAAKCVQIFKVRKENVKSLHLYCLDNYYFRVANSCCSRSWDCYSIIYYLNTRRIYSIITRGKVVRLAVTCKNSWAASKNLQNFIYFSSAKCWKKPTKSRLILQNSTEKLERLNSSRQTLGMESWYESSKTIQKLYPGWSFGGFQRWSPPSAWRLGFLAKKFLGFLKFPAKILAIILGKVRRISQDFWRLWKEIKENSWQQKQEKTKILARETRKSCIKVI